MEAKNEIEIASRKGRRVLYTRAGFLETPQLAAEVIAGSRSRKRARKT